VSALPPAGEGAKVRLAELMAALSMATDLAMGQPMEQAIASCIVSVRLGEAAGLGSQALQDTYYLALLRYVGCNADVAWLASIVGDEIALRREFMLIDGADDGAAIALMLRSIRAGGGGAWHVAQAIVRGFAQLPLLRQSFFPGHCEVASRLAERMGFAPSFQAAVAQLYARWDGKGVPALKGDAVAPAMQVVSLAQDAVNFLRAGGMPAMLQMVRERRGKAHSPRLCDLLCAQADSLLAGLDAEPVWEQVLAMEPGDAIRLDSRQLDAACEAMADFIDLKSPHHLGHSRRVAELAAAAAGLLGLGEEETACVRRAGWLHDIGRAGVSASFAHLNGPLTDRQWEQIRLHPYYTERILARCAGLADVARLAALHHERLDGSGYAKGLRASMLPPAARLLAAADLYCSLREARPHRAALDEAPAAAALAGQADAGRLDRQAVDAVLSCAGITPPRRRAGAPGGLSERECEVLRHLARGATLKQVARTLDLSVKTVDRHVQNIYTKIGVSTRAAATLYAVENHLV